MIRQERRRTIRDIDKELKWIDKHTPFKKLSIAFAGESRETLDLLSKGEHSNENMQKDFTLMGKLFNRIIELNHKRQSLKTPADSPSDQGDRIRRIGASPSSPPVQGSRA